MPQSSLPFNSLQHRTRRHPAIGIRRPSLRAPAPMARRPPGTRPRHSAGNGDSIPAGMDRPCLKTTSCARRSPTSLANAFRSASCSSGRETAPPRIRERSRSSSGSDDRETAQAKRHLDHPNPSAECPSCPEPGDPCRNTALCAISPHRPRKARIPRTFRRRRRAVANRRTGSSRPKRPVRPCR